MLITDIYTKYKIVPFLQLHQLRVAAVTQQICDSLSAPVDAHGAVVAALLHDMGNILKFDFSRFPEVFEPEGVEYWRGVQDKFRLKYGPDEHEATLAIAKELGVSERILGYMQAVGFRSVPSTLADPALEKKICCYADQRVAPFGVVSILQRLEEGGKRYAHHPSKQKIIGHSNRSADGLLEMERQMFVSSSIRPEDITDQSVAPLIDSLRQTEI